METKKLDPRVARTRQMIIAAFIHLSEEKPFEAITVKDITEEALINRATFYNHFLDKYDLMEKALEGEVAVNMSREKYQSYDLDETLIVDLFSTLVDYQAQLAAQCQVSYQKTINQLMHDQLFVIHHNLLVKKYPEMNEIEAKKVSVMFASSLMNLARVWGSAALEESTEEFISQALPYLKVLLHPAQVKETV